MGSTAAARLFLETTCGADSALDSFDATALRGLLVLSAEPGRLVASLPLDSSRANAYGTAHGGLIATAVDVVSSAALHTIRTASGVSVSLGVDYLAAVPVLAAAGGGSQPQPTLIFDARVVKAGRSLAVLTVDVLRGADGALVAKGRHTKFVAAEDARRGGVAAGAAARPRL
jgi:acyl-coenzyme A thioesterase 13